MEWWRYQTPSWDTFARRWLLEEGEGGAGDGAGGGGDGGAGGAGGDGAGDGGGEPKDSVTQETLRSRLSNQKRELETKHAEDMRKLREEYDAKKGDDDKPDVTKQYNDLATKFETQALEFAAYRQDTEQRNAMARAGVVDPEAQDMVLYRYGKLSKEDRPSLDVWLKDEAKKDRFVAPLLEPKETTDEQPAPGRHIFSPNRGVAPNTPNLPGNVSIRDLQGKSYDEKVRLVGSHEALEKMYGLRPGGLPRPRK